ncbi:TIGR02597 family protein [Prosthecobacter sp. SYSU 5D2]|uniref:TIGR02597 family protein n=1 Tax=Prosthecobacter sp. SYSU 5D2 TaxID=3134134 RepID=UPI0031FF2174
MMKRIYCLAASCLLAATAIAQTTVTTPVMGFLTLNLTPGTNFMGFALLPSMEMQGLVNIDAGRTSIFLQGAPNVALINDQFNTGSLPSHTIEISGSDGDAGVGFTSVITDTFALDNEIVLADAIPEGVADGATVKIWKLWTLADVFGADNSAGLTDAAAPAQADLIQIPNGVGFDQYFYSNGEGEYTAGWRLVGDFTTDQGVVPLEFAGGIAITARSAKSVVIVGQVKPGNTRVNLQTGNNFVANLCPVNAVDSEVGLTLETSGLQEGLTHGLTSVQADRVLLWDAQAGGYIQYYYSAPGGIAGTGWRRIGAGMADQKDVPLPDGAYIIHRVGGPVSIQLNQGAF